MTHTEFRELTYAYLSNMNPCMLSGQTLDQWHSDPEVGMIWGTALMHKPEFINNLQSGASATTSEVTAWHEHWVQTCPFEMSDRTERLAAIRRDIRGYLSGKKDHA